MEYYSVITGDIVKSSNLTNQERDLVNESLIKSFTYIISEGKFKLYQQFEMFRGDSFQGVLQNPVEAFTATLLMLSQIRQMNFTENASVKPKPKVDLRLSIGIGTIDYFKENVYKSDGQAFQLSGRGLDKMSKKSPHIILNTPIDDINEEFELHFSMLDILISKWTTKSAEVINMSIRNMTQSSIAEQLNIKQSSVNQRIDIANWNAIEKLIKRFRSVIKKHFL